MAHHYPPEVLEVEEEDEGRSTPTALVRLS